MCLEVESLRVRSIQMRVPLAECAGALCAALLRRYVLPEELVFSPAGSALANHLIPYLLFRSGLGSRPHLVASSTPLP